jgi:hypothetical protein
MRYYLRTANLSTTTISGGWKSLSKTKDSRAAKECKKSKARDFFAEIIGIKDGIIRETVRLSTNV